MEKKRICLFCESWESGGIESFLAAMLGSMDLSGLEIDIVASRVDASVFTLPLQELGIGFRSLSGSLRSPENYRLFRSLLRQRQYSAVHFNLYQGLSLYYVHLAKRENVPLCIVHSHNTALRKSRGRAVKLLLHSMGKHLFAGNADLLWACSKQAADFLFPAGLLKKRTWRFIPNGIDTSRFAFSAHARESFRNALGLSDEILIGSIGRLCRQKNQSFLLEAFAEIMKSRPDSRLLLVGEGELRCRLEQKAQELGIAEKVIFFGTTPRPEDALCAMDVLAFPSLFEGLGIVAVEAQASGLPVLCSENVPEEAFLGPLCRRLELSLGPEVWAKALMELSGSGENRSLAAEQIRRSGFDRRDAARILEQAYREVHNG